MANTDVERSHRAELQRARRLARRICGNCGASAEAMLPWGGQPVPICGNCQAKLAGPDVPTPWCAFNEVHPLEVRPWASASGVLVEARLLPAPVNPAETPQRRRSLASRFLGALGRMLRLGAGRKAGAAITGKSD